MTDQIICPTSFWARNSTLAITIFGRRAIFLPKSSGAICGYGYVFDHGKIIENPQSKKHALLPATAGIPIRSQSCRSWSSMVVSGDTMKTVEPIWKMGKFDWSAQKAPKFKAKTHFTLMCCFLGTRCQTHLWAWGGPTRALAGSSHIPSAMPPWCG